MNGVLFFFSAVLQKLLGNLREGDIGQHILIALGQVANFGLGLFKAGLQQVGIAALNGLFVAQDLFAQFSKARGWPEACADPLFFPSGLFLPDKIPHFLPKTFLLYYKIAKTANF